MQQKSQLFCIRYKLILRHGEMFDSSWSDEIMEWLKLKSCYIHFTTQQSCNAYNAY